MAAATAESKPTDAILPPRKETFLAFYPRKLKLGVVGGTIGMCALLIWGSGKNHVPSPPTAPAPKVAQSAVGADKHAAIANAPNAILPDAKSDKAVPKPIEGQAADAAEQDQEHVFMTTAPDPGLVEDTPRGSLPRVGEDGRQPWQVYARPFDNGDRRPRISIVITDLGLLRVPSEAAINRLPPQVTLAFDVQSPVVGAWCARARNAGHETILMLPMEPFDYPRSDPGPNTLLSNLTPSDNLLRLQNALMQASGYVGVTTLSGTRFTTDPDRIKEVLRVLRTRGLMIFDARVAPHSAIADLAENEHVPVAVSTLKLDQNLSPAAINEALTQLEQTARLTGRAVAYASSEPVIIDQLLPWFKQLHKDGIALAPLSAMVQ